MLQLISAHSSLINISVEVLRRQSVLTNGTWLQAGLQVVGTRAAATQQTATGYLPAAVSELQNISALDLLQNKRRSSTHCCSGLCSLHQISQQQQHIPSLVCLQQHSRTNNWLRFNQKRNPQQQQQQQQQHWYPWQQQQYSCFSTDSSSSKSSTTPSSSSSSNTRPKNAKGTLPDQGPSHKVLRALPFTQSRSAAVAAFTGYHSKHWYQSRQRPALSKPFKESYLPFWVGSGSVHVEVRGAEVGHQHLVTRYDKRTGKSQPQWETVWSQVRLHMAWSRQLQPEEKDMQIYASWKYFRRDVQRLAPGLLVSLARAISPDMLQASPDSQLTARRVGPFTLEPIKARRLLMATIESKERQRAEQEIAKLTGAQQVRFIDMHCTWHGSTGAAAAAASGGAAAARGGLDLMPVYVPAYVFSWWHGGAKVRTFVSGVDLSTAGVHVLDDTKIATVAALAAGGFSLMSGIPLQHTFWGAIVVPFFLAGFVARFWPLVRTVGLDMWERYRSKNKWFWQTESKGDYCETDWNAAFVHSYDQYERRQQQAEQRSSYRQSHQRGGEADPFADFEQMFRDPLGWFEKVFARQQQQQQRAGSSSSQWEQQYRTRQQQTHQQYERGSTTSQSGFTSARDPKGYYKTLGVQPHSTTAEIQSAFRGLALQHHPDKHNSPDEKARATKRFQQITEAYQVLRDPKKRGQYDSGMMA